MTTLFEEPKTPAEPTAPDQDTIKNYLEKFKTPEELAKAKYEADQFIERLKAENAGMRQELSTKSTLEQLMDKLAAPKTPDTPNPNNNQGSDDEEGKHSAKSLTEDDIAKIVESRLSAAEKVRVQNANLETVRNTLVAHWGPNFVNTLKTKASELGLQEEFLTNLAKEQPKAFLKLVEVDTNKTVVLPQNTLFSPPTGHSIPQSTGFSPTSERTKAWYDALKAKNASEYWSSKIQNQMHKDALRLGDKFFDT